MQVTVGFDGGDGFSDGERLLPRTEWWSPVVSAERR
jgi:hypothetical protein